MIPLFHIYRSSAGSGKTRTLAKEYLKLALQFRSDYFKHILAVTFTNKSTQEMKGRIMHYLNAFVNGGEADLAKELQDELKLDEPTFQDRTREVQSAILHEYQYFSISTIDAFFQRVIRSFTREAGVLGDYRLELEVDEVMEDVINSLIAELGSNEQLTQWLVELALQNLENDKSWDVRQNLLVFSKEIFREEFKRVQDEVDQVTGEKNFFGETMRSLQKQKLEFIHYAKNRAQKIYSAIRQQNLTVYDFKHKSTGSAYSFVKKISQLNSVKDFANDFKRAENDFTAAENWIDKKNPRYNELLPVVKKQWVPLHCEIMDYRSKNLVAALSAEVVLNNFYQLGLISDLSRKLNEYKRDNNIMLLADAAQFLNKIIDQSDTPFIYEKMGSFYRNYLIDEFQDTSGLQWKNLKPLITNSLDSGYSCLIVGDVKQAIYRWRGGDQNLLQQRVVQETGHERSSTKVLDKNFRSDKNIVLFNNQLFKTISSSASHELNIPMSEYSDAEQLIVGKQSGFVQTTFISSTPTTSWKETALLKTAQQIEDLQQRGVAADEITLLVRTNKEGAEIISYLSDRKISPEAKSGCIYEVVSNESLSISNASTVNLIVAAMTYLLHYEDTVARAQLIYEYTRLRGPVNNPSGIFSACNTSAFETGLPELFTQQKIRLKKLSLFELTETLIEIFLLKNQVGELPFLLAFQNLVLDFQHRERNDLSSFLEWWKNNKYRKYISAPAQANAMSMFTIHKAKGLQFNYVIIPFCSWSLDYENSKQPLLWEKPDHASFSNLGYLPVKYSFALKNTVFEKAYEAEHKRIHLDNLNLLYVALTRAKKGLIIFAPTQDEKYAKSSVAKWIYEGITKSVELANGWNETTATYQSGEITASPSKEINVSALALSSYITSTWQSKLVIKQTRSDFSADSDQQEKMKYGVSLHATVAKIKYSNDIDRVLLDLQSNGSIHTSLKEKLNRDLSKMMNNRQVADWFSDRWNVQTEVVTLLPGGKELRIDRLLTKDKHAIVIDFKTGDPLKADYHQVTEYCDVLVKMGFQAEGYLVYLNDDDVQRVVPPQKPKNKKQLGLDF
ncbi:MAG: ATP-dependent helicase [Cytophagales bacterium]|nr:UvrD-helicase domain-containing protein [Bacteroidota bacterium]MBS1981096.1 UvrD-helicase domain-containing protein [Bacteroidota bacterium]WHZ08461.1 MAG: ATP-dependent helicase [Cytophagales bacterium]